jgi:phospholipid/cholesterol/gamma-HCH transport system ATP-binding protein
VLDPQLIMYDEPFTGQDPIAKGMLVELIRKLKDNLGLTSIIVSHDVHETAQIADYIYIIAQGKVIGHGTPSEVMNSDDPQVKQFIRGQSTGPVAFHYPAKPFAEDLHIILPVATSKEACTC